MLTSLFALLPLLALTNAAPARRSPPQTLQLKHRAPSHQGIAARSGETVLTTDYMNIDFLYEVTVSVGTPPQEVSLSLGAHSAVTSVQNAGNCLTDGCRQNSFVPAKSSSLHDLMLQSDYGRLMTDNLSVGKAAAFNQLFTILATQNNTAPQAGGELALGGPDVISEQFGALPIWQSIAQAAGSDIGYALKLDRHNNLFGFEGSGGELTFSGYDDQYVSGEFNWLPHAGEEQRWGAALDAFHVNGTSVQLNATGVNAMFDVGAGWNWIPKPTLRSIMSQIPGSIDVSGDGSGYTYPCGLELELDFTFGGQVFKQSRADFAVNAFRTGNTCHPQLSGWDGDYLILGAPFLKNVYSVYATNRSVALFQL